MTKPFSMNRVLVKHFFRRFFDSDTIQVEGETLTTVIRAISAVAVPSLIVAFFLQNEYPRRSLWGAIEDQYFFVLFSFVVMGGAAIVEWDMLFPDRLDFLVLSPLPIKPLQLLRAKAAALAGFLALFLFSSNLFGALVLPIVSQGNILRHMYAHSVAVALAGLFVSLGLLALGGVLLCILGGARYRALSPAVQLCSITLLLLLLIHYLKVGDSLQSWLREPHGLTRWLPPLWFLGLYEVLLRGASAPAFAWPMAVRGLSAILVVAAIVMITYPLGWARMRRLAIEGTSLPRKKPSTWWQRCNNRLGGPPAGRAAFFFISQTLVRNNRYQVFLAIYAGTGLALAMGCAVSLQAGSQGIQASLSNGGLHAVMPLLLFWIIAGLRTAFAFPVNLAAGWVFRISGASVAVCAAAARTWALAFSVLALFVILGALRFAGWGLHALVVQLVCGLCLCLLLSDGFFFLQRSVPFNQPRMPGRTSLPLLLTLYIGVLPPFLFGLVTLEGKLERNMFHLLPFAIGSAFIHAGLSSLKDVPVEVEEQMEAYEGEFQLLGLSFE